VAKKFVGRNVYQVAGRRIRQDYMHLVILEFGWRFNQCLYKSVTVWLGSISVIVLLGLSSIWDAAVRMSQHVIP
jgi:hypothetical protein